MLRLRLRYLASFLLPSFHRQSSGLGIRWISNFGDVWASPLVWALSVSPCRVKRAELVLARLNFAGMGMCMATLPRYLCPFEVHPAATLPKLEAARWGLAESGADWQCWPS